MVQAWREETGLQDDTLFEKRLSSDHLSSDTFSSLVDSMGKPSEPYEVDWIDLLEEIFSVSEESSLLGREELSQLTSFSPFAPACWPFLLWADVQYHEKWKKLAGVHQVLPFARQSLTGEFLQLLAEQLTERLARMLTLELNVARLQGNLHGKTPQERFQSFVELYITKKVDILSLLEEYPVLARLLAIHTSNWVNATIQAVERLCKDYKEINAHFSSSFDEAVEVSAGISDPHRKGQSVLVLGFKNGERLVYKPKPLAVDRRFQALLYWLNESGATLKFPLLTILDCGEYGWEEFVEPKQCGSVEQVKRFYHRQGGYLAVLHTLSATDFHCENVIAAGEFPYLVDLETLFHHRHDEELGETATERAYHITTRSILETGMLPSFGDSGEGQKVTDLSGLGGEEGQDSLVKVLQWKEIATDNMRAVREYGVIEASDNRPLLQGTSVGVKESSEDFLQGFETVYKLLMKNQEALADRVLDFRDDIVRQVLRPTYIYSLFLEGGLHPDFLRNGLDRDRFIDRLWAGFGNVQGVEKMISSERYDLLLGDVPYFYTKPGSLDLWDSQGRQIPNFFETNGLQETLRRCRSLSEEGLIQQTEFIKVALEIGGRQNLQVRAPSRKATQKTNETLSPNEFIDAAIEIGDRLETTAIWSKDHQDATWLEPLWLGNEQWQLGPANIGLYNGLSGIAFYLAYLAKISGQKRFERLARAAKTSVEDILKTDPSERNVSALRGRASFIYTLMHLSSLWEEPALLDLALEETRTIREHVSSDSSFDLLDGCAGTIIVLLHLYEMTGSRIPYETAVACGNHLLAHAQETPTGHGWKIQLAERPLAGFSHGASGISWALATLGHVTGDERLLEVASSGLKYERGMFDPERGNWQDLRVADVSTEGHFPVAWCNGAPGIGIARLLCLDLLSYEHLEEEIDAALATTLSQGFGGTNCLCHGDFGNMELLLLAAEKRRDPRLTQEACRIGMQALDDARKRQRWLSGWSGSSDEALGLMIGLAGIGHGLLRLGTKQGVPSPLYLAPPVKD